MRVSAKPDDPGYTDERYDAFLDGELVADCVTADTDDGTVEVMVRDAGGKLKILGTNGSARIETELRHGEVTLRRLQGRRGDSGPDVAPN